MISFYFEGYTALLYGQSWGGVSTKSVPCSMPWWIA